MIITSVGPTLAHALANFGLACLKAQQEPTELPKVTKDSHPGGATHWTGRPYVEYRVSATTSRAPSLHPSTPHQVTPNGPEAPQQAASPTDGAPTPPKAAPIDPGTEIEGQMSVYDYADPQPYWTEP